MKYTIAMCNLNNSETIEASLDSILAQIDNRFEIVIVDDGSEDGSLQLLRRYERNHDCIRVVEGENDNLAEARNQSFRVSNGEHIIESMDLDDRYDDGISDFVKIYEALTEKLDRDVYLKGKSINVAPKELLLEYPYRSMGYGEDKDLWRRLFADDRIIWLEHESFCETVREEYTTLDNMQNLFDMTVVRFRSGVTPLSFIKYSLRNLPTDHRVNAFRLLVWPLAYLRARNRGIYEPPSDEFHQMGELERRIQAEKLTFDDLLETHGLSDDLLSEDGEQYFRR